MVLYLMNYVLSRDMHPVFVSLFYYRDHDKILEPRYLVVLDIKLLSLDSVVSQVFSIH